MLLFLKKNLEHRIIFNFGASRNVWESFLVPPLLQTRSRQEEEKFPAKNPNRANGD